MLAKFKPFKRHEVFDDHYRLLVKAQNEYAAKKEQAFITAVQRLGYGVEDILESLRKKNNRFEIRQILFHPISSHSGEIVLYDRYQQQAFLLFQFGEPTDPTVIVCLEVDIFYRRSRLLSDKNID